MVTCNLHITYVILLHICLTQGRHKLIAKFRSKIICEIVILKQKYQFKCRLETLYPQLAVCNYTAEVLV